MYAFITPAPDWQILKCLFVHHSLITKIYIVNKNWCVLFRRYPFFLLYFKELLLLSLSLLLLAAAGRCIHYSINFNINIEIEAFLHQLPTSFMLIHMRFAKKVTAVLCWNLSLLRHDVQFFFTLSLLFFSSMHKHITGCMTAIYRRNSII